RASARCGQPVRVRGAASGRSRTRGSGTRSRRGARWPGRWWSRAHQTGVRPLASSRSSALFSLEAVDEPALARNCFRAGAAGAGADLVTPRLEPHDLLQCSPGAGAVVPKQRSILSPLRAGESGGLLKRSEARAVGEDLALEDLDDLEGAEAARRHGAGREF